jgi:hypothetical protein
MANTRERNIGKSEAAKVDREKLKDQPSLNEMIDQHGHHITGQQLGNVNADGLPPLTEQEKRNRGESHAPKGGEAAWRGDGVETRPSENKPERLQEDLDASDRPTRPGSDIRAEDKRPSRMTETRPSHP